VTPDSSHVAPSYCTGCQELLSLTDASGSSVELPCPVCGTPVHPAVGRFAGIVSVVRFVADLSQPRRSALMAALQPERHHDQPVDGSPELKWLTEWLANHDVATSLYWRRCLILALQLTPISQAGIPEVRLLAAAREVARQAGASQSFAPRRY
jgi:hypothetical protein